jgi:endonuclease YncB( thermonuclease family)
MLKLKFPIAVCVALAMAGAACARSIDGRIVGVSDGDTVRLLDATNKQHRVRLGEIDAPESTQAFGSKSKQALSSICFGKAARVLVTDVDRYGRLVGRLNCAGTDAQAFMVSNGMAWVYTRYAKDPALKVQQERARASKTGLWSDASPVPPWEYRRQK